MRRLAGLGVLCGGLQALRHILSISSPGPLHLAEPHPQNTLSASAGPHSTAKILGLLLLEQCPPKHSLCWTGGLCFWGQPVPQDTIPWDELPTLVLCWEPCAGNFSQQIPALFISWRLI